MHLGADAIRQSTEYFLDEGTWQHDVPPTEQATINMPPFPHQIFVHPLSTFCRKDTLNYDVPPTKQAAIM